jgi:hypothetical protein
MRVEKEEGMKKRRKGKRKKYRMAYMVLIFSAEAQLEIN